MFRVIHLPPLAKEGTVLSVNGQRWVIGHVGHIDGQSRILVTRRHHGQVEVQSWLIA